MRTDQERTNLELESVAVWASSRCRWCGRLGELVQLPADRPGVEAVHADGCPAVPVEVGTEVVVDDDSRGPLSADVALEHLRGGVRRVC